MKEACSHSMHSPTKPRRRQAVRFECSGIDDRGNTTCLYDLSRSHQTGGAFVLRRYADAMRGRRKRSHVTHRLSRRDILLTSLCMFAVPWPIMHGSHLFKAWTYGIEMMYGHPHIRLPLREGYQKKFPLLVTLSDTVSPLSYFSKLDVLVDLDLSPDFGTLDIGDEGEFRRSLRLNDDMSLELEKEEHLEMMDENIHHLLRNQRTFPFTGCQKPAWTELHFPVCNNFHEITFSQDGSEPAIKGFLGSGNYRDGFLFNDIVEGTNYEFVLKALHLIWYLTFSEDELDRVRREALVMERLSASDRISNIYGHCASSILVEPAPHKLEFDVVPETEYQAERGRITAEELAVMQTHIRYPVISLNNLTVEEKLNTAIAMAESLAELHGFSGSAIVNDDVILEQWLVTQTGRVVLTDFNFAIFLQWHDEEQKYCKVYRNYGTPFRAPEMYEGGFIDEAGDVFPMGHLIFNLLTGLYPYSEIPSTNHLLVEQMAIDGKRPSMNPAIATRSLVERRLVEIMDQCYESDPNKRVTIFDVVEHLRHTETLRREERQKLRATVVNVKQFRKK